MVSTTQIEGELIALKEKVGSEIWDKITLFDAKFDDPAGLIEGILRCVVQAQSDLRLIKSDVQSPSILCAGTAMAVGRDD